MLQVDSMAIYGNKKLSLAHYLRADLHYQTNLELSLKHLNQKFYGDLFCFDKKFAHWKLCALNVNRP